jgi:hypothetical protein
VFIPVERGQRVAWLVDNGIEAINAASDLFEVPTCSMASAVSLGLGDTPEEVADEVAQRAGMKVACIVVWPNDLMGLALV